MFRLWKRFFCRFTRISDANVGWLFVWLCIGFTACQGESDLGISKLSSGNDRTIDSFAGYNCKSDTLKDVCQVNICKIKASIQEQRRLCEEDSEKEDCEFLESCVDSLKKCIEEIQSDCAQGDEQPLSECLFNFEICKVDGPL